ncbi:hypothetical protein [Mesorhizobium sp. B2-5-4]|uniref:ATP-binding protein n=1 Tax=Mesorhizobium sp. B2-5-4 TaxID=2589926 RepID=UPI0015E42574|nr:hypothetical protein [Mesorhizobium sp. B2-5-4]
MARIDAERRTVLLEIEEKAVRYIELKLGLLSAGNALRLYRERHRSGMMGRASDAFALITHGQYSGLATQPVKGGEVLIALQRDGKSKVADALSKGARFQLYLALRLAGYYEFAQFRPSVPFIADDIMETFDHFRSEEVFRLFGEMASAGQVIYLTHHQHLSVRLVDVEGLKRGLSRIVLPSFKAPSAAAVRTAFGEIDWRRAARGDFSGFRKLISEMLPMDIAAAKDALRGAVRKEAVDEVRLLASSAAGIASDGGIKATFRALEYADDAKDLSRARSLSARMGEKTSAVLRVLGKGAIKLGKLVYLVASILIAVLGWFVGALWFVFSWIRTSRRLFWRKGEIA